MSRVDPLLPLPTFPSTVVARTAQAAYRYGYVERAFDERRTYESAQDLLDSWAILKELQEELDFFFHGRPNEEPTLVPVARRVFFRGLRQEVGA